MGDTVPRTITYDEWIKEAQARFGTDSMRWKFVCPVCGHVASVADWKRVGAGEGEVAFSCVGRHIASAKQAFEENGTGPCTYAGGGLFRLNPVTVRRGSEEHQVFEFAATDGAG